MGEILRNYINGRFEKSLSENSLNVTNPATGEIIGQVPMSTEKEVKKAINKAKLAFPKWRKTPPVERARYLFKLHNLITDNFEKISRMITKEEGKNLNSARGEVQRALENVEVAAGIPSLMTGYNSEDISRNIDEYAVRQPMGVFAAIAPFNFPVMVPFWFLPYAIATGNTYIVKPSEKVPFSMTLIAELIDKAEIPEGVVNVIHGNKNTVNVLLESEDIEGISFVGSTNVAKYIYSKSASMGKRVQCQGGACNFIIVMPDANIEKAKSNIVNSFFACAGQRCLAGQNLVVIGEETYQKTKKAVLNEVNKIEVGNGLNEKVTMGPIIDKENKARVLNSIQQAVDNGAEILVDGRDVQVDDNMNGYFIGPTVLTGDIAHLDIVQEEIFGPVLNLIKVDSFDEAINLINNNKYGNAANIYTQNGKWARKFIYEVEGGNIGINIGVPAPVPHFPFSGMKESFFGDLHAQGRDVIQFFTENKIVIERWF